MSFFGKLEDKLINFLTAICWWFDAHFNLKSKDLANPFMSFVICIVGVVNSLPFHEIAFLTFAFVAFHVFAPNLKKIYLNSGESPNPNKINYSFKIGVIVGALLFVALTISFNSLWVAPIQFSWFYVLCTEPMPPAEREKRLNKNKSSKLIVVNQV